MKFSTVILIVILIVVAMWLLQAVFAFVAKFQQAHDIGKYGYMIASAPFMLRSKYDAFLRKHASL